MGEETPRRLTLLYQLYLTSQASRRFMRIALADADISGEEYAACSYLYANGPQPLSHAARHFGLPITTLAGMLAPLIASGDISRLPHPTDGRARLLALTSAGRERLERVIPEFTAAYQALRTQLDAAGVEDELLFQALGDLRAGIERTNDLLEAERISRPPGGGQGRPMRP